ncbi:DnaJ family protein [Helicobacter pullorum]|uniref:Cobalamin ABC transporter permease n=1 Tax=Helicobacter pullorum TaxID=35818 RepID=A0A0N1E5B7_9HELI|nr:DnaJ family protein [Helicobacter pullorum]KAB0575396.1 DnaJ family protein [Helicobacter pullorum NCTC 12824]KPH49787.1 cobalamin ABC transporter permease [Helicobacter pullorum]KPH51592.1 cobalamin ABC transporter permease [Helicobacter pullorum]KPH52493.1 cobalamin ABC transporter permease [Helicobacter pullorum]KPH55108.1 cobalamin ABC transporter permease [Helicobacter pullorum]
MSKSLYETLEVSPNATSDEIKKSYRRLARKYHPDINKEKDAEEKFKEINAAYEILSDEKKRKQYDQFGDSMFGGQNFHDFARGQGNVDLDDILSQIFGGGGFSQGTGGFGGFESFGGFGGFGGRSQPNLDINAQITIPFSTAILGGKHNINLQNQNFDIKIPAGIRDGETIRLRGKGKTMGNQSGDVLLKVSVAPHPQYSQDGDNLTKKFDLPLKTALFGGKVEIETLYKTITLKVPKNTKNNQRFRVKELGAYNRKSKTNGDLYLEANIILPDVDSLPKELTKALEKYL